MFLPLTGILRVCNDHHVSADNIAECELQQTCNLEVKHIDHLIQVIKCKLEGTF